VREGRKERSKVASIPGKSRNLVVVSSEEKKKPREEGGRKKADYIYGRKKSGGKGKKQHFAQIAEKKKE